jgi:hypothetical protein
VRPAASGHGSPVRLYARSPVLRGRQVLADAGLLLWLVLWVVLARVVHGAVLVLAEPGRAVEDLAGSVAGSMGTAADAAQDVPLVGEELAAPFEALSGAGGEVSGAGQAAQDAVGTLATVLAVVLVVLPVGWLLLRWLPWRLGWLRDAAAAERVLGGTTPDLELLAARALATAPLPALAALPEGTGAAWRAGDATAVRTLAGLELRRLGLSLPAGAGQSGSTGVGR